MIGKKIMHRNLLSKKSLNVKFKLINEIVKKMKNKKEERLVYANLSIFVL